MSDRTTIVVGASRGLGRGIATAFARAGAPVIAVARTAAALDELAHDGGSIQPELADAGDPSVAGSLLDRYEPEAVILVAGASPLMRPLQHQDEAKRAGLGIVFTAVLPRITPLTDLGRPAVRAYAARSGQSEQEYLRQFGEPLTPEVAGAAAVELVRTDAATVAPAYLLTRAGLQNLP